jgi:Ser/Thr protein kinase RdoA (MazF antagonist)
MTPGTSPDTSPDTSPGTSPGTSTVFPVTHSILSTQALVEQIVSRYDVGEVQRCRLHNRGLTDTFILEVGDGSERLVLRVYRAGWRTDADVLYELDALLHLHRKDVPVSYPLADREGTLMHVIQAPEGRRQAALFTYAPGAEPGAPANAKRDDQPYLYGRAAAAVHAATDDFTSEHTRFQIDLHELLDRQMVAIQPLVEHRTEDWQYLLDLVQRLREQVERLPLTALEAGFCHGDFHGGNCHLDGDTLTFFDFDCCGPGWRAYDIAVYLWGAGGDRRKGARRWREFLRGYREVRLITRLDLEAVPLFVSIRHIWLMGLHTANGKDWGHNWMGERYFDRHFKFLREWDAKRLAKPIPRSWKAPLKRIT